MTIISTAKVAERLGLPEEGAVNVLQTHGIRPASDAGYSLDDILDLALSGVRPVALTSVAKWGEAVVAAAASGHDLAGKKMLNFIQEALLRGERVYLPFGTLVAVERPERRVFRPATQTYKELPPRKGIRLKLKSGSVKKLFNTQTKEGEK